MISRTADGGCFHFSKCFRFIMYSRILSESKTSNTEKAYLSELKKVASTMKAWTPLLELGNTHKIT
jgi:hypothetical protein